MFYNTAKACYSQKMDLYMNETLQNKIALENIIQEIRNLTTYILREVMETVV